MKLAVALLLAAASGAQANYSPADCANFFALAFSQDDFDRYNEFYRPTSTYTVGPAGTYYGVDGIKEYVKFATPFSPFLDEFQFTYYEENIDMTRFDSETGTCAFTQAIQLDFKIAAPAFAGLEGEMALYTLLKYEIDGNYVSHVDVFFPPAFLDFFFGSALNTDGVRKYVCEVMRDSCSTTWAANGYDSTGLATCVDDLESLSISDPPPYIDGKSQGCRFLHAVFAAENDAHCPHISLIPIKDINEKTVCQESALNPVLMGSPGSPFTVAEKEFFEDFVSKRGIPEMGYKVNPTVPCGSAEDCPVGLVCETAGGRRLDADDARCQPTPAPVPQSDGAKALVAGLAVPALAALAL